MILVPLQSKAVLVLLSLGKFYKALDMLYRHVKCSKLGNELGDLGVVN